MALRAVLVQKILGHWLHRHHGLGLVLEGIPDVSLIFGREQAERKQELFGIASFNCEFVSRLAD